MITEVANVTIGISKSHYSRPRIPLVECRIKEIYSKQKQSP